MPGCDIPKLKSEEKYRYNFFHVSKISLQFIGGVCAYLRMSLVKSFYFLTQ